MTWSFQNFNHGQGAAGFTSVHPAKSTRTVSAIPNKLPHYTGPGFHVYRPKIDFQSLNYSLNQAAVTDRRQFIAPAWSPPPVPENTVIDKTTPNLAPAFFATGLGLGATGLLAVLNKGFTGRGKSPTEPKRVAQVDTVAVTTQSDNPKEVGSYNS